jgi:hypothetical protein
VPRTLAARAASPERAAWPGPAGRGYRGGMGMLGELFPGRKLADEGGEDGEGELVREPFDIDLDSGVVRLRGLGGPPAPKPDGQDR